MTLRKGNNLSQSPQLGRQTWEHSKDLQKAPKRVMLDDGHMDEPSQTINTREQSS